RRSRPALRRRPASHRDYRSGRPLRRLGHRSHAPPRDDRSLLRPLAPRGDDSGRARHDRAARRRRPPPPSLRAGRPDRALPRTRPPPARCPQPRPGRADPPSPRLRRQPDPPDRNPHPGLAPSPGPAPKNRFPTRLFVSTGPDSRFVLIIGRQRIMAFHKTPANKTPTRAPRHDGWTPERQLGFFEHLSRTGNVRVACAAVGLSRAAAYRQRHRDATFDRRWSIALGL